MNFPAALALAGIDPFLSDERAQDVRRALAKEEQMIASLDAEIAQAQAALAMLIRQRNESQRLISINSAPSDSEARAIRQSIAQGESHLEKLQQEMEAVRQSLRVLLQQRDQAANSSRSSSNSEDDDSQNVAEIDAKLDWYRNYLTQLEHKHADVQADVDAHIALLSPVRRLPMEILSEIFLRCLPEQEFVRPSPTDAPLLLMQVCRVWRNVAMSTPGLWSSILVTTEKRCRPHFSLIEQWLKRSAPHPLSFCIEENLYLGTIEREGLSNVCTGATVFQLFLPAYPRWKRFRLDAKDWRVDDAIRQIPKELGPPPQLESLSLKRPYWGDEVLDHLHILFSSPLLQSISWHGILSGHTANPPDFMPLAKLRELKIDNLLTKRQFFSVLRNAPNLVVCKLTAFFASPVDVDGDTSSDDRIASHHLRVLSLTADAADDQLFDALVLPSLEVLQITRLDRPVWNIPPPEQFWSASSFATFYQKSRCALNTLELTDTDIKPYELFGILRMFSASLRNLILSNDHVDDACVDDEVLRSLTASSSNRDCLCPFLGYIKLWGCMSSTDGAVADMLESRWDLAKKDPRVSQLRLAMIMFKDDALHPKDIARLEILNKKRIGLTLLRRV